MEEPPVTLYGQSYNSSDMCQLLGIIAFREERALQTKEGKKAASRGSQQLSSLGKIKVERKLRASVPDAFSDRVPEGHSFTCVSVFESLLRGEFGLLYGKDGRCIPVANTEAPAAVAPAAAN